MKNIADIGEIFARGITLAVTNSAPTGLDELHYHFNFIENYNAQDLTKILHGSRDDNINIVIEPPMSFPLSLRAGLGLAENACHNEFELSIYVLKRLVDHTAATFFTPTRSEMIEDDGWYKSLLAYFSDIDACRSVLQKMFEAMHLYYSTEIQIVEPDIIPETLPPGFTTKEEVGIHTKVKIKWY